MEKTRKRFLLLLGLLALAFVVFPLLNWIWFSVSVPASFAEARWTGTWKSDEYWLVSGRIVADLPEPIPRDQDFNVDALVYYDLWCQFRTGSSVRMSLTGFFPSEGTTAGGSSSTPVVVPTMTFSFKGGPGPSAQTIQYVGLADRLITTVVGGYRSVNPHDLGRFAITKR